MVNLWKRSMSMTPTWAMTAPNRSGLWLLQAATSSPPLDPPCTTYQVLITVSAVTGCCCLIAMHHLLVSCTPFRQAVQEESMGFVRSERWSPWLSITRAASAITDFTTSATVNDNRKKKDSKQQRQKQLKEEDQKWAEPECMRSALADKQRTANQCGLCASKAETSPAVNKDASPHQSCILQLQVSATLCWG